LAVIHRIKTIDAHAAGEPLRLVIDGLPSPEGRTMLEKRAWAMKRLDHLRRGLMLEPRGHTDMYGALLTEPVSLASADSIAAMRSEIGSSAWTCCSVRRRKCCGIPGPA
jgi:trans-L-3-hydroxyproline dehydratase